MSAADVFRLFDKTGANTIPTSSLGDSLRAAGKSLTIAQCTSMTQKATTECGAALTFAQFEYYLNAASELEVRDQELARSFLVFDNGAGEGMVDIEAFKSAMCALGDKMKPSEINTILKDAGWDGEDSISHQDLLKLIQNIA